MACMQQHQCAGHITIVVFHCVTGSKVIILFFLLGNNYLAPTIGHTYEESLAYSVPLTLSTSGTQFVTPPVHRGSFCSI